MKRGNSELLLGIDLGTSVLKVGVYDTRGRPQGVHRISQRLVRPRPGWAEMDPADWWRNLGRGVRALRDAGVRMDQVAAIGLSCLCPCVMLVDQQGRPRTRAVVHQDRRSLAIWRDLPPQTIKRSFHIGGNPLLPGTASVLSLLWFRAHRRGRLSPDLSLAQANTFLGAKLTGTLGLDGSQAALSGLFDVRTNHWSSELCELFGINARLLPPLVPAGGKLGVLIASAAKRLGLRNGIPVAIGGADTACAALGLGKTEPGEAFLLSGTTEVLGAVVGKPRPDRRLLLRPHVRSGAWLLLGAVSSGGASLQWARRVLRPGRSDGLSSNRPGGHPLFLPYLAGERTGICDPQAKGAFLGLQLETSLEDLWLAVREGTAMGLRQLLELIEPHLEERLAAIACAGGGMLDREWLQVKADTLGRSLILAQQEESALRGAALLGGLAAGIYGNEAEMLAIARDIELGSHVRPNGRRRNRSSRHAGTRSFGNAIRDSNRFFGNLDTLMTKLALLASPTHEGEKQDETMRIGRRHGAPRRRRSLGPACVLVGTIPVCSYGKALQSHSPG